MFKISLLEKSYFYLGNKLEYKMNFFILLFSSLSVSIYLIISTTIANCDPSATLIVSYSWN